MPSVNVVGTLLNPLGTPAGNVEIRFTAITSQGQTIESSLASFSTAANGTYNFSLEYGRHTIEVNLDVEYILTGEVIVDAGTPNPLTLTELITYLSPVVPPVVVPGIPDWQILHSVLRNATDTLVEDKIDPLASGDTHTREVKQLFLNPRLGADMAEENVITQVGLAKVESQTNVYEDDNNHQSIQITEVATTNNGSISSSDTVYDASSGEVVVESSKELTTATSSYRKDTSLANGSFSDEESILVGTSGYTRTQEASTEAVEGEVVVSLNVPLGNIKGTRTEALEKAYTPEAGVTVNKPRVTLGTTTELNVGVHSAKTYENQTLLLDGNDELQTTQERGILAYAKKAYQKIINNGFISWMFTRVDNYIVESSLGEAVFSVDTVNKVLRIDGRLEITNPDDFKGEPGDTIFQVFKYSPTPDGSPNGPSWHDDFVIGDNWRIFNNSVNGYVDPSKWSIPVQLNGIDGAPGDTLYYQYQYSADNVNWHTVMEDLDIWRRERVIENGNPTTPWSAGTRIRGFDGADADLTQYEYSYAISGLAPPAEWHFNFTTGDHFRRERIIYFRTIADRDAYIPGSNNTYYQATPWNNIMQIVPINGVDYGAKQATIYIYRRSTTVPPAPTGDLTWNFDDLTLLPTTSLNGWSLSVPSGSDNVYVGLAVATSIGSEDVIGASEWNIEQWTAEGADGSDGIDGVDGKTPAVANLFCISVNQPAVNFTSVTQTLATNAMVVNGANTQGWQGTVPSNTTPGGRVWYMTNAQLVLTTATTATHLAADFSVPSVFSQNGLDGAAGLNNATILVYQRAASVPTKPSVDTTYTFSTKSLTGLNNGWTQTIPAGTNPLYVTAATASASTPTDTIAAAEWATPVILTQNGLDGLNSASIFLYRRLSSVPPKPSTTSTYTFATGVLTGHNNGWTQTIPAGSDALYVTTATAISTGATDTITSAEWATPNVLAQNGTNGTNGNHGQGSFRKYVTTVPDNASKDADVLAISGRAAQNGDLINYYKNDGVASSQFSRYFFRASGTWTESAFVVNGSSVIDGTLAAIKLQAKTITGDQISSATTLIAGSGSSQAGMNGFDSGIYSGWRFWAGSATPSLAPFRVDSLGKVFSSDMTIAGGKIELVGTTHMKYSASTPFGPHALIEWYGPKINGTTWDTGTSRPIPGGMSRSNGITYLTAAGKAYFGGGIIAGDFRNAITTTQNSPTATSPSLVFGSNGGLIDIVLTGSNSGFFYNVGSSPAVGSGATSFTILLEKKVGANWTTVATLIGTGNWQVEAESGDRIGQCFCTGSLTYTDADQNVNQREYRARMTTRDSGSVPVSDQEISIVTSEIAD